MLTLYLGRAVSREGPCHPLSPMSLVALTVTLQSLFPPSVEAGATGVVPRVSPGPEMPTARAHQKPGPEQSAGNTGVRISGWAEGTQLVGERSARALTRSFRQSRIRSAATRGPPTLCEGLLLMGRKLRGVGHGGAGGPHVITRRLSSSVTSAGTAHASV